MMLTEQFPIVFAVAAAIGVVILMMFLFTVILIKKENQLKQALIALDQSSEDVIRLIKAMEVCKVQLPPVQAPHHLTAPYNQYRTAIDGIKNTWLRMAFNEAVNRNDKKA